MKKTMLVILSAWVLNLAEANNAALFKLEEQKIHLEFERINRLEEYLLTANHPCLSELNAEGLRWLHEAHFDFEKSEKFSIKRITGDDDTLLYILVGAGVVLILGSLLLFCLFG